MNKNFEQWADEVAASDVDLSTPPDVMIAPQRRVATVTI